MGAIGEINVDLESSSTRPDYTDNSLCLCFWLPGMIWGGLMIEAGQSKDPGILRKLEVCLPLAAETK